MAIQIEFRIECRNCGKELDCEYIESIDVINVELCQDCLFDAVNHAIAVEKSRHCLEGTNEDKKK